MVGLRGKFACELGVLTRMSCCDFLSVNYPLNSIVIVCPIVRVSLSSFLCHQIDVLILVWPLTCSLEHGNSHASKHRNSHASKHRTVQCMHTALLESSWVTALLVNADNIDNIAIMHRENQCT